MPVITRNMNNLLTDEENSNDVIVPINGNAIINNGINITENCCPICFEDINNNSIKLSCGHNFHNDCIINWFRMGNQDCPYCRSIPDNNEEGRYSFKNNTRGKYQFNRKFSRRKDSPKQLKQLVTKLQTLEKLHALETKKYTKWKKSEEGKEYARLTKISYKLRSAKNKFVWGKNSINSVKNEIAAYPIIPVFVKVKKRNI